MKLIKTYLIATACILFFAGCAIQNSEQQDNSTGTQPGAQGKAFSIVNWNVQTFFDAKKDGCEYSDFQKSTNWNSDKYKTRVERLCEAISQIDADIYVFEEIENEEIIYDISNQLTAGGHNWNQKKFWNYSAFAKQEGTAIGIGILSRYPLSNVKTHSMDIRLHQTAQPSSRYIVEATVSIEKTPVIIFANHWKSKSGGEAKTEIWRDWQESILAKRLEQLKTQNNGTMPATVICGDFNRDASDFICSKNNTILRLAGFGYTDSFSLNSLWFSEAGNFVSAKGSYYFDDSWERIDNIFILGNISSASFEPLAIQPWANAQGIPVGYKIYSGEGWSDHLPVTARLFLTDKE